MAILSSGRALLDASAVLRSAGLGSGMRFADLGCGPLGHFVFPAAEIVGKEGRVYAVDILKSSLASVESRMRIEAYNNISTVWGDFERPNGVGIPAGSLHVLSIVNIIEVLIRAPKAFDEMKRLLVPEGRVLLVDWKRERTAIGPPIEHRVSREEAELAMTRAGFALKHAFDAGPYHWAQVFGRV
ncbi:methyltransferase domain-containing protein [bacterium]|nr:methyltransferase domain-containing protein [bacterium]